MSLIYDKEQALLPTVNDAAAKYNIPPALILAHIKQESGFDQNAYRAEPAIGDASYGLMQVLLKTAQQFVSDATAGDMLNPGFNVNVGSAYIAQNLNRYNGNVMDAIAAYNAGTARKNTAGQYVNSQGNTNVQSYVDKVYSNYQKYTEWLGQGATIVDIDYSAAIVTGLLLLGVMVYVWKKR